MVDGSVPGPGRKRWKKRLGNRGPKACCALNPPGIGVGAGSPPEDAAENVDGECCPARANGCKPSNAAADPIVVRSCRRDRPGNGCAPRLASPAGELASRSIFMEPSLPEQPDAEGQRHCHGKENIW